jgi:hypothetical protein
VLTLKHSLSEAANISLYAIDYNSSLNISVVASGLAVAGILSQTDAQYGNTTSVYYSKIN